MQNKDQKIKELLTSIYPDIESPKMAPMRRLQLNLWGARGDDWYLNYLELQKRLSSKFIKHEP